MKIAIQGHPTRGYEIIQILESLGGINQMNYEGGNSEKYYYIARDSVITVATAVSSTYTKYTLKEFEKEFPFKVGDKVQTTPYGEPAEVTKIYLNPACGISYKVRYKSGVELQHCPENLKFYKEMKEERNITLTLDKAKEWYRKGGELKEIALQAFTETELNPLPRSWEEFRENNPVKAGECWLAQQDIIHQASDSSNRIFKNWIPSKKSAEAHLAMIQLEQLRDCWRNGWKPEYHTTSYAIKRCNDEIHVIQAYSVSAFLSFPTQKMAEDFLACFRDLIEKAGDLI